MHTMRLSLRLIVLGLGIALIAACTSTPAASPILGSPSGPLSGLEQSPFDAHRGVLEAWPVSRVGGTSPHAISNPLGVNGVSGMAGDGRVVAFTSDYPPEVAIYNIETKSEHKLKDPFGTPIDIAIDKNEALYALNIATSSSNVAVYAAGSTKPTELTCAQMQTGEEIAVDNEGDVFINGYTQNGAAGVVEIPIGSPQNCTLLNLNSEPGYVAGLAIDPKTDDLIVLDDPDLCAGGVEGRMTIYPKPYSKMTGRSLVVGQNCSGGLRLNADSTIVYVGDQDVSGSFTYILQRSYPDGRHMGSYHGGSPGGFTTIPNTLPN
jgi:hypothetical protein